MKKHIAQWLIFTVIFTLIPLLFFLLFSFIFKTTINKIIEKTFHELYFYSIIISTSTLRDLLYIKKEIKETAKFTIAFGFTILLLLASTTIYGMILFIDNFTGTDISIITVDYIDTLFACSLIFSIFTTIINFLVISWRASK